jgi:hypothetical protein
MQKWVRNIRGSVGIGFAWGAAWAAAGMVLTVITRFQSDAPFPLVFGILGFFAGVTFSALLALTQGRRSLDQMSIPRFAVWGSIGGLLLSGIFGKAASLGLGDMLAIAPTFALASAACASASLAIARRAVRRQLPDTREDTVDVELTNREKRELL